jgi:Zn-dependent protease with chaperone function
MEQFTYSYASYWITVYFTLLSLGVYGYLRLRNHKNRTPILCLRYFGVLVASFLCFWLTWKFAAFLLSDLTLGQFGARVATWLTDPAFALFRIFIQCSVLLFFSGFYRSRLIHTAKYMVIIVCVSFGIAGVLTAKNAARSGAVAEFPAGEKRDYLEQYLDAKGYSSQIYAVESSEANAWVSDDPENKNIYFTTQAIRVMSKERLLGNMTHEIGHKYEPTWALTWRRSGVPVAAILCLGLIIFLAILMSHERYGEKFGLIVAVDKSENLQLKSVLTRMSWELTTTLLICVALSLPAVMMRNYLQRIEESHADLVAKRLLEEAQLPVEYRSEGLRILYRTNFGSEEDANWLFQLCFNDHPPIRERMTALHSEE